MAITESELKVLDKLGTSDVKALVAEVRRIRSEVISHVAQLVRLTRRDEHEEEPDLIERESVVEIALSLKRASASR